MRFPSRLLPLTLAVLALSAAAANAQAPTELTDCTNTGVRAAVAAGGSYVFRCTGATADGDETPQRFKKLIYFGGAEQEIVVDKDVTLDGSNPSHEVWLTRSGLAFDDPFLGPRLFKVLKGATLKLKNLYIDGGQGSLVFGAGGEPGMDATLAGTNGGSGIAPSGGVPAPREGGCMYVAADARVELEGTLFTKCWLYGVFSAGGGYGGRGAPGLFGSSGTDGSHSGPGVAGGDGLSGGAAGNGGSGGNGAGGIEGGEARGGAIFNAGTLVMTNATFEDNKAQGGDGGYGGSGGNGGPGGLGGGGGRGGDSGVDPNDGTCCTGGGHGGAGGDSGAGGHGGIGGTGTAGNSGGNGVGGAIYNAGQLTVRGAGFKGNLARGGPGGGGGGGGGGGSGGSGGGGPSGGRAGCQVQSDCPQLQGASGAPGPNGNGGHGGSGGTGGRGGNGFGGAVYSKTPVAVGDLATVTLADNAAERGAGGQAGTAGAGGPGAGCCDEPPHGVDGANGGAGAVGPDGQASDPNIAFDQVEPPTAAFSFSIDPQDSYKVKFDATASKAGSGTRLASLRWDFGDTKAATTTKIDHTYKKPGKYRVTLTVRDGVGQDASVTKTVEVRAQLDVKLKAKPSKIEVEQTSKGPKPVKVELAVTVKNTSPVAIRHVTLPEKLEIALLDEPEATKKALKQTSRPKKRVGKKLVDDLELGTLKKGDSETRTYELKLLGDGKYTVEALVTGVDPDNQTARGAGRTEVEGRTPWLFFAAKVSAKIKSQENPSLVQAGTPYLIRVKLQNRSYTKRLLVYPVYAELDGNATDGHMQEPGLQIRRFTSTGVLSEVRASRYIDLPPRAKRQYDVVVRTSASDGWNPQEGRAGGTRSIASFSKPKVATVSADVQTLTPVPKNKILMGEDSERFTLHLDDSGPKRDEGFNIWEARAYMSAGALIGLWNVTWGAARGLLWDLPILAGKTLLDIPTWVLTYVNHQVELWYSVKSDPELRAAYIQEVFDKSLEAFEDAPYLLPATLFNLYQATDQAVGAKYDQMAKEWYAGDWRGASLEMGTEVGERFVDVALAIAPGVLARSALARDAWQATKTRTFSAAAELLAPITQRAQVPALRAAEALRSIVQPGMRFTTRHLQKLYGLSAEEAGWLSEFTKRRRISVVLRSRLEESLKWINEGAFLKPYWIKLKNVNWTDVEYLGYHPDDVGRLILREPPSFEEVARKLQANGIKNSSVAYEEVQKRWKQRLKEFGGKERKEMFDWHGKREVEGKWPWQENGVDPYVQADETSTHGFRLRRADRPGRPNEYIVEIKVPGSGEPGRWGSVTGDIDLIAITASDGRALSDVEHVAILKEIREGPMGALHPESATWVQKGKFWFEDKLNYLTNDGVCCLAEFAADGIARAVQFNEKLSKFVDRGKHTFRAIWDGGYKPPPSYVRRALAPRTR